MAKGNIFMGTVKGRIGNNVFYVKQGEQNIIKYQSEIANPKTNGQCYQRSKFGAAGKFYAHGTQALFKFAFESKKKNESDFNAFMRENISNAIPMSKRAVEEPQYPMVNDWLMTKGTLKAPNCYTQLTGVTMYFANPGINTNTPLTVADLSRLLLTDSDYQRGDIITFVAIKSYVGSQAYPAIIPDIMLSEQISWKITQFRVDTTDMRSLQSIGLTSDIAQGEVNVHYTQSWSSWLTSFVGGAVIHSRPSRAGLKVSTNRLQIKANDAWQQPLSTIKMYASSEEYINMVTSSWKNNGNVTQSTEIMLEGALISKSSLSGSGQNPMQSNENFEDADNITVEFDPRGGYLLATPFAMDNEEAIDFYESNDLRKYYYNKVANCFLQLNDMEEGEPVGISLKKNSNGTFTLWCSNGNDLYVAIAAWVSEAGEQINLLLNN